MSHPHPAYFAHVDGLRALAVLAYHLHPQALPGGFTGVDVFFVISGFVVTASRAGHRDERLRSSWPASTPGARRVGCPRWWRCSS